MRQLDNTQLTAMHGYLLDAGMDEATRLEFVKKFQSPKDRLMHFAEFVALGPSRMFEDAA